MAKISTYPQPTPPSLSDFLIGTDTSDSDNTKNFEISDIITLATTTNQFVTIVGAQTITGTKTFNTGSSLSNDLPLQSLSYAGIAIQGTAQSAGAIAIKAIGSGGAIGLYLSGSLSIAGDEGAANTILKSNGPGVSPSWAVENKGYFYNSATQTFVTANVGVPLTLPTTSAPNTFGISVVTDGTALNRITFTTSGSYRISPNITIVNTVTPSAQVYVWLRKNGVDLALTARVFSIGSSLVYQNFSLDYAVSVSASDYIQVMCSASNAGLLIGAEGSTVDRPAIPSSVVTINSI